MSFVQILGAIASIALPLFNIPLILKIRENQSSKDFSLGWALGVWGCIVLMFPSVLISTDTIFRIFGTANLILFSVVVFYILKYRKNP